MALSNFAPYRLPPGSLPDEAQRLSAAAGAEPLLAAPDEPLPARLVGEALALVPAGRAQGLDEACRAADGSPSGSRAAMRPCLVSERHRARVAESVTAALTAGYAGVCLDRPDAPLAEGTFGAGFCPDCQRAFSKALTREYGDHFQPLDYLALAREAVAQAPGAVGFEQLPFGRDFWRFRTDSLDRALTAHARTARDLARAAGKAFAVTAQFEAAGPAQLHASRHLDAAVFPAQLPGASTGVGAFRLLRAVMGRRPCGAAVGAQLPQASLARVAAVGAACGVEVVASDPLEVAAAGLGSVRHFARALSRRDGEAWPEPVIECAVLYSAESDLWSGGAHREQVERAGEALAALHAQAPVVTRVEDAPAGAVLVLAGATALAPQDAAELSRRVEAGGLALVLGALGAVDGAGRPAEPPLPPGKPAGARVGKGTVAALPALPAPRAPGDAAGLEPLAKALNVLLGKGRRAASAFGRAPLLVVLQRVEERLDVHLVTLGSGPAQGTTLFLGHQVAGTARWGRFQSAAGAEEKIGMNPAGYSISTVLPAFQGYAVLSIAR
ncbi:type 1 glutamine amidotransferase family protein [Anaeromyxobacter paludicola]|uniref:Uncharacterized protein n=1 Tax=Anaeromyxobacter paludicola TaxID=2918171 RepID=A0ABM7XCT5_9BACT|nr:hypothetical protein [Anaeromyxobacter paludicola]BDG09670.1 hypothetical protein AMPC_27830 [Anaeromyxobacter paludicola]